MPYAPFVVDGSQLKVTIASTPTKIEGVMSLTFTGAQKTEIEYTAISDTARKWKGGKPDYGSMTFELAWDPAEATHAHLLTSFQTPGSTDAWTILCSDAGAATVTFNGSLMEFTGPTLEKDNIAKYSARVKLDGAYTVTP